MKVLQSCISLWIRLKNVLLADPSRLCMRFRARCLAGTIVRTFIGCWNFIGILRQLLPFKLQTAFERHLFASLAAKYVNEAALLVTHHFQVGFIYVEPYNCQYIFFKYKYISPNISHHGCVENCKTANLCLLIFKPSLLIIRQIDLFHPVSCRRSTSPIVFLFQTKSIVLLLRRPNVSLLQTFVSFS